MKFYGGEQRHKRNTRLYFGSNPNHHTDCPIRNQAITQQDFDEICSIALQ